MEWQRRRPRSTTTNKPLILYCLSVFFFFFSFCALFSNISSSRPTVRQGGTCPLSAKADVHFQEFEKRREEERWMSLGLGRRFLSGPGSLPPRCSFKCGKCTPCKPVHVPVPPGTPVTSEYYPEAWRCKCGNKLYMP